MSNIIRIFRTILPGLTISAGLFFWTSNLHANGEDKAEGKLIVNNKETQLNHAYALARPGFFDKSTEDIVLILTDVPLSDEAVKNEFKRKKMASDGSLHCLEIRVNANKQPISVSVMHNAFRITPSGRGYEVFEATTFDKKTVEGKIHTSNPEEFDGTTYEYSVTFKANVRRKMPPTKAEKEAAAKSPQADAYRKYEKALKAGDFEGLKKLVVSETLDDMNGPDAEEMFKYMQQTLPSNVVFLRMKADGEKSVLEMSAKRDGQKISGKVDLILEGKQWKVGWFRENPSFE